MSTQVTGVRRGINIEIVSIIWMIVEAVVAIGAGIAAHSLALTTFGADSIIELIAGGILVRNQACLDYRLQSLRELLCRTCRVQKRELVRKSVAKHFERMARAV